MFDDQPVQSSGAVPNNLPIAEPEDILSTVDEPQQQPSALSAGILKAKEQVAPPRIMTPPSESLSPDSSQSAISYPAKGPVFSRILIMLVIILLAGALLGGAGWFLYTRVIRGSATSSTGSDQAKVISDEQKISGSEQVTPTETTNLSGQQANVPSDQTDNTDSRLLFGEPIDTDGDGLTDDREKQLGTDVNNWDTDNDDLSDYNEVTVWKTDPKNPDTDGDTYLDGAEVKNGYNPAGPGKIFEPPMPKS